MTLLRIIALIFIAFASSRAYLRFKEKALNIYNLIFWIIIWISALILIYDPKIADKFATLLGLQGGTDTALFLSVMLLFYLVFRVYVKIDSIDQNLTRLNSNASILLHKASKAEDKTEIH